MGVTQKTVVKTNTKKNSVQPVTTKVVTFQEMWDNYPSKDITHQDSKTKKDLYENHCAIKLSESLYKSGIELKSFNGSRCSCCPSGKNIHALVAQELADWLKKKPFPGCPEPTQCTGSNFKKTLDGKKGIAFFKDYWQRKQEFGTKLNTGDHIDLWDNGTLAADGSFISFLRITLGLSWDGWFSDHTLSKEVLFWEIK